MKKIILPAILVLIALILAAANFTPGTFLSGWDTMHPEFNLILYLQRAFWGVWQQHQGLGAVAVQAQASELGRLWYLLLGSFIPENLFRYGYFWLTLIIGPLGVYFLLNKFVRKEAAFVGALFYLLNLGTMQNFYLPLEMFATAYAFLPWLFWAVVSKKIWPLVLFFILSAPMANTPTLWAVNFVALVIFALTYDWRWGIKVAIIGLIVNSFWLLPTSYYVLTHGEDVANSHISQQFSSRAISVSKEFGNLFDIALIKGYLFDWGHFDFVSRKFADLFPVWKSHLANPLVLAVGYGSFAAVVAGILISLKKRSRFGMAMFPVLLISIFGMMAFVDTEALRFPFTKFSFLLILAMAIFIGLFIEHVCNHSRSWVVTYSLVLIFTVGLVYYMWPAFQGNLICNCERVEFPVEYQQTFDWFEKQDPNTRIAPFPIDSIYGWGYYSWGYEGAGFRWFGLPQPLLDREFDRWMPQNENYYWEISQAVYSKNLPLFESVLEKYRVNWLLVDENIIDPSSPKALYTQELENMISKSESVSLKNIFGKIKVYSFALRVTTKSFVSIVQNLPNVGPSFKWSNLDQAYFDNGDYLTVENGAIEDSGGRSKIENKQNFSSNRNLSSTINLQNTTFYPLSSIVYAYRTLFTGRTQADLEFDPASFQRGGLVKVRDYPTLSHRDSYLIKVKAKVGVRNLFWVEDLNSRRAVLETYIKNTPSYFVVPPMESDGLGYAFHLDNMESLEVYKIDYFKLITLRDLNNLGSTNYINNFTVYHPNPSFYKINLVSPGTIILSQSYDSGWIALGAKNHVLISNWTNGWEVEPGPRVIYLFYWPQLLEFAGFGILTIFVLSLIIKLLVFPQRFFRSNASTK